MILLALGIMGWGCGTPTPVDLPLSREEPPCQGPACLVGTVSDGSPPDLVVFAVLDTVRSSRTSLCGHDRPTTPFLQSLVDAGASHSCRAETPSSWTIPSHASFFTGVNVPTHGTHRVGETVRPLDAQWETLAEKYQARGYDTLCISANSFVSDVTGLTQGCDFVRPGRRNLTGTEVVQILQEQIAGRTPGERGLFVFLNFYEAHDPWQPVPKGVEWVKARQLPQDDASKRWAFVRGEMKEAEAARYLAHVTDLYDHGIFLADQYLGESFEVLRLAGLMEDGTRWVITSDHGELLGEHGLLNHGKTLFEQVTRVPVVAFSWPRVPVDFGTRPFSATSVFHLALDGNLGVVPVVAVDLPSPHWSENTQARWGGGSYVAAWEGARKLVWKDGQVTETRLDADPREENWIPAIAGIPDSLSSAVEIVLGRVGDSDAQIDPQMLEMLQALGYAN